MLFSKGLCMALCGYTSDCGGFVHSGSLIARCFSFLEDFSFTLFYFILLFSFPLWGLREGKERKGKEDEEGRGGGRREEEEKGC